MSHELGAGVSNAQSLELTSSSIGGGSVESIANDIDVISESTGLSQFVIGGLGRLRRLVALGKVVLPTGFDLAPCGCLVANDVDVFHGTIAEDSETPLLLTFVVSRRRKWKDLDGRPTERNATNLVHRTSSTTTIATSPGHVFRLI